MSLYLLDSDSLTLFSDGHPQICHRVLNCPSNELAISIVCVEEALSGWYVLLRQGKKDEQIVNAYRRMTESLLTIRRFPILTFDLAAAVRFRGLRATKVRIGTNDLRIACTALESGAILVTRNMADFKQVAGLHCEDWTQP